MNTYYKNSFRSHKATSRDIATQYKEVLRIQREFINHNVHAHSDYVRLTRKEVPLENRLKEAWKPPAFELQGEWPIHSPKFNRALSRRLNEPNKQAMNISTSAS